MNNPAIDDTAFVQNIINNSHVPYLGPGDYYCRTTGLPKNCHLVGEGKEVTRIFAHNSLDPNAFLLQAFYADNVSVEGIGFSCAGVTRAAATLMFVGLKDLHIEGVSLDANAYMGLALQDTYNAQVERNVFLKNGTGIWVGATGINGATNKGTKIYHNDFRGTRATPISIAGEGPAAVSQDVMVDGNTMYDIGENAMYINPWTKNVTVQNNTIDGVVRDPVEGDNGIGIELQGDGHKVLHNTVRNIAWSCFTAFQPRNLLVEGNTFENPGQEQKVHEPGNDPSACMRFNSLGLRSVWQPSPPYPLPRNIQLIGNTCIDAQTGVNYGIVFQGEDDCLPFEEVYLQRNNTLGGTWLSGPEGLLVKSTRIHGATAPSLVWGSQCTSRDNFGFKDMATLRRPQFMKPLSTP